jgi:hypothetical protein
MVVVYYILRGGKGREGHGNRLGRCERGKRGDMEEGGGGDLFELEYSPIS